MADTFSDIVFGASFDPSVFIEGFAAIEKAAKKFQEQEEALKKTLGDTEAQLKDNAAAQNATQKALDEAAKAGKRDTDAVKALNAELDKLKAKNQELNQSLTTQQQALNGVAQKNREAEASYAKVRTTVEALQKQAGQPVKLNIEEGDVLNALQTVRTQLKGFSEGIDWSNITDDLKAQILTAKSDIEGLTTFVEAATAKLAAMDPGAEGYQETADAVRYANEMLENYNTLLEATGSEQDSTGQSSVSLRTRIRQLRDELTRLEDAELDNTETYRQMQIEAGRLTDQYGDMQQRIRILASDTVNIDFGLAALQAVATGFQTATGAMELFGLSNEDAEEAQRKLLAVMNLVQGAQQLVNLFQRDNVLILRGGQIANAAYAASQRILAVAIGTSTGALKAFKVALITTGVGALVFALGALISKLSDWTSSTDEAKEAQDRLNATLERQQQILNKEIESIEFNSKIREQKLKQRGAKEVEIFTNGQETLKQKLLAYNVSIGKIRAAGLAAESQIIDAGAEGDKKRLEVRKKTEEEVQKLRDEQRKLSQQSALAEETEKTRIAEEGRKKRKDAAKKDTENVYAKELARLNEELAKAAQSEFRSEDTIRAEFTANLEKQFAGIDEYLKKKQLTKRQANSLKGIIRQIIDLDQKKALEEFAKQVEEIKRGIEATLQDLRFADSEKRIAAIQNEFQRETEAIALETKKQRAELNERKREAFASLNDDLAQGFINQSQFDSYAAELTDLYEKLLEDIKTETAIKSADLAEKIFTDSLDQVERNLRTLNLSITEGANQEITALTQAYMRGEITYRKYQESLTTILKVEAKKRKEAELNALDEQIKALDDRLTSQSLSPAAQKAELERLKSLRERRAALDREIQGGDVEEKNTAENKRIQGIVKYVESIGGFIQQVISFWQTANEAEQRSIERSIALQDRRVAAAEKVAARGNASYLKMEEEKQQELLLKQENAARRQMAINAALQASQLLVAVTGAVSKIATPGIGTADVIASIGVIIGALASGYALVKSLQSNQPSFYEGTDYVEGRRDFTGNTARVRRMKEPSGRDTIPAWLHEGESVNDAETTARYHPTIKAMHEGRIPPDFLNRLANLYPRSPVPMLNTDRMMNALNVQVVQDARMSSLLEENTKQLKAMRREMKQTKASFGITKEGIWGIVQGMQAEFNLRKKA